LKITAGPGADSRGRESGLHSEMETGKHARIELSAGGVICRRQADGTVEVLLIEDGYGNWGFPKGHVEAGERPADAALRECGEETGLARLRILAPIGVTDWYFRATDALVHKFCDYFLVEADPLEEARPQRGEGIRTCVWLSPEDALSRVTYDNARHVLRNAVAVAASLAEERR
jgi:8-oxo-dGTP pyrophosphatase MutT (NUDIX family)